MDPHRRQRIYDDEQVRAEARRDASYTGSTSDGVFEGFMGLLLIVLFVIALFQTFPSTMRWISGALVLILLTAIIVRRVKYSLAVAKHQQIVEAERVRKLTEEAEIIRIEQEKKRLAEERSRRMSKILVVDDQVGIRFLLLEFLGSLGYECFQAANGRTALEILDKHPVRLVLLDIKMPGLDGVEVLTKIRESGSDVKVIMMTAYDPEVHMPNMKKEIDALGVLTTLIKPFTMPELQEIILKAVPPVIPEEVSL